MESTFSSFKQWISAHRDDIMLLVVVILISLLSFALGYIFARQKEKEPIKIETNGEKASFSRSNYY